MVIFHVLVNLTSLQFDQRLFYWVPAGFILFLGVILARFLKNQTNKKIKLAAKLLAIFLLFNIPNFISKNFTPLDFIKGSSEIFSFEILLPMALVILLTNLFDKIKTKQLSAVFFLLIGFFILNYFDIFYYNLTFITYGLIGYFAASARNPDDLLQKYKNLPWLFLYLLISIAPFFIIYFFNLYDTLILLQIFAMYFAFNIIVKKNKFLTLLGKYSLFLYVGHIVIIKLFLLGR